MGDHQELLARHTALFNAGVRSGDFGPMIEGFADDADLIFEGIPVGPFHGKPAIAAAYRSQPPDDEIALLDVRADAGQLIAAYAWGSAPLQPAGTMILTPADDKIARLVVIYGAHGR